MKRLLALCITTLSLTALLPGICLADMSGGSFAITGGTISSGGDAMSGGSYVKSGVVIGASVFVPTGPPGPPSSTGYVITPLVYTPLEAAVAPTAPSVTTGSASSVSTTGATLNGVVTSNGASTAVTFNYGTTTGYGSTATAAQSPLALNASGSAVSAAITGLTCNTLYHFRVVGTNSAGTTNGSDATFTTSACSSGGTRTYTWTATGGTNNSIYRISPDGTTVTLGSFPAATSSYTDTSALSNTIYTFCVKADNVDPCLQSTTIRTPLYNGWNIIGVPYDTTGIAVASLFSSATSTAYEWISKGSTDPDNNGSYITLGTLTPGKGYFIKAGNSSTMVAYTGAANAATVDVTLKPGWTLISNPYTTNKTGIGTSWLISGLGTLDAAVTASKIGGDVYWWNGNTYDSWKITDLTIPANSAVIEPWKAYWILNMDTIDHTLTMQ